MKKTICTCDFCGNDIDYSDVLFQRNSFGYFIQKYDGEDKVDLDICKPCMLYLKNKFQLLERKETDNE